MIVTQRRPGRLDDPRSRSAFNGSDVGDRRADAARRHRRPDSYGLSAPADSQRSASRGQALTEFALVVPLLLLLLLAIGDFARLYTSEIAVEAAAREAADYGAFNASQWSTQANSTLTVNEMIRRACVAVSTLPDYLATGDSTTLCSAAGSNPVFSYVLEDSAGSPIVDPPANCGDPATEPPCLVHVTMSYTYHTFFSVPPYPATLDLKRDSRFAISNLAAPT